MTTPTSQSVRWPRLRRGLAVAAVPDGLLLEGGPSRQLLTGAAATALLPRLLPLLDGTRDPELISAELMLGRPQLGQALSLLNGCGLLEWVQPAGPTGFGAQHVATYMSRTIGVTGSSLSADDLAEQLASAAVILVAPPALAGPIAADLTETGVGMIHRCAADEVAGLVGQIPGRCVAAVFDDPSEQAVLGTVAAACRGHDLPVLRFSATAGQVEVGPAFSATETACVSCFRRSQAGAAAAAGAAGAAAGSAAGLLAGLVTSGVLGLLTRQPPVPAPWKLVRTAIPAPDTEVFDVVPELDCASCAGGTPPQHPAAGELLAYEWRVANVPAALAPVSASTPAEREFLGAIQRQRESFATSPRHRLPAQAQVAGPVRCLDEAVLAAMLARIAGFRDAADPDSRRWAPSGGNMASVAAYLCTGADLFGLPGTIYRYDDIGHQLLSVHASRVSLRRILDGTDLDPQRTDMAVVLVGAAGRLWQKYGDFAWRLVHLDAGCAALQLHLVAASYGLPVTFASSWPRQLAELLELVPGREVVTAVAAISVATT